ncbi:transmembrane amino acid transporter protein-domain-containing protein [Sphaerosporella brunnea]|uniref:Transmembrane amino acid transporter protein-domain-containing protein n=1 Tax=Sphaerosporella brunnea TaxID=1250544 RepID=A0A5J5EC91_9PEZI|nr:transmembrane amino acid transporter protein-domain-containing protein [Sphaerosporella brunnea]
MPSTTNYSAISQTDVESYDAVTASVSIGARRRRRDSKAGHSGQATWISSVVNLLNTILGAGVLAMPHAMSQFGIVLGVLIILFSGAASGFGLYLQARCSKYVARGTASFFSLSQLTYPNAAIVFDAAIAIKCFGVAVSYLIIIGDLMPQVVRGFDSSLERFDFMLDRHFWITVFMLVVIPLSFLRRLDSLKYTSFIALVSIGYLILIVVGHYLIGDTLADRGEIHLIEWAGPIQALSTFPVVVFAYTCHQNMFAIVNEIEDNSHKSTLSVVLGSICSAAGVYVLVAITGYLSFGDHLGGNIIAQYASSLATTIGCAAIVVLVVFSYPLQIHPCRGSIDNILKWRPRRVHSPAIPGRTAEMSDIKFAVISTILIVATYIVAMSVSNLSTVLAYVGSTGSTAISFILPGIFYWKISNPDSDNRYLLKIHDDEDDIEANLQDETLSQKLLRQAALGLACYGVFVMITCLSLNIFYNAKH